MTQHERVYAICCRPEVAGDVISGENVKTIERYALLNFEAFPSRLAVSEKIEVSYLHNA